MELFPANIDEGLALARQIGKGSTHCLARQDAARAGCPGHVFLAARVAEAVLCPTRPRVIKWYCPFASQQHFPSGHRYCINLYTGCSHACEYCYAAAYEPAAPGVKRDFIRSLERDLADLECFEVPPVPVHLSNSTDPFQPLEKTAGHTRLALQRILEHRGRFTSVVVLTKNPRLAVELDCIDLFLKLDSPQAGFLIEVSLAFWREEARQAYDPGAPGVQDRIESIRCLRQAGVPVVLRIDPVFPRFDLANKAKATTTYRDFDLPQPQTLKDLEHLVAFGKEAGVRHVVYSAAKIVQPRMRPLSSMMQRHAVTLRISCET